MNGAPVDNRGGKPVLNVLVSQDLKTVEWTCPHCNTRNQHNWYGREKHVCVCEEWTDIKGTTIGTYQHIPQAI